MLPYLFNLLTLEENMKKTFATAMQLALWINKQNFSGQIQEYYMAKGIKHYQSEGSYTIKIEAHHLDFVLAEQY
jgi:hypothetical protein